MIVACVQTWVAVGLALLAFLVGGVAAGVAAAAAAAAKDRGGS